MNIASLIGKHVVRNLEELSLLASMLTKELRAGDVVLLHGDLGAGKTTFTQYLGQALGVKEQITSPTYTLMGEYPVVGNGAIDTLVHMDLYRARDQGGSHVLPLTDSYIQEVIMSAEDNRAVIVIEWAEQLGEALRGRYWNIVFTSSDISGVRDIVISCTEAKNVH